MRISDAYPSKYLRASDLQGRTAVVMIDRIEMEQMSDGELKPCVYFQGKEKGVVLNKTNANNIAAIYGDDTDGWAGKLVELFTAHVDFQGKTVEAIRIKRPSANGSARPPARPVQQHRPATPPPQQAARDDYGQPVQTDSPAPFDDSIPF